MSFSNCYNTLESVYINGGNPVWSQPMAANPSQPVMNRLAVAPIMNNIDVVYNNGNLDAQNNLNCSNVVMTNQPNYSNKVYGWNTPNGVGSNVLHTDVRYVPRPATNIMKKPKRNRTAFTTEQVMVFEQEYAKTPYLHQNRRMELAKMMNLNERTIKVWFQNRRMKEKKEKEEYLQEVSTTEAAFGIVNLQMPLLSNGQYPSVVNNMQQKHVVNQTVSARQTIPMIQNVSYGMENLYQNMTNNMYPEHSILNNSIQELTPIFYNEENSHLNNVSPPNLDSSLTTTNISTTSGQSSSPSIDNSTSSESNLKLPWLDLEDKDFW